MAIQQKSEHQRLGALTALRFLAAILVVLGHTQHDFLPLNDFPKQLEYNQAVTFFFALSGFILTYVYPELPDFARTKAFIVKRFARLWPLHLSTFFLEKILVAPMLVTVAGSAPKFLVAVTNLAMLHAWVPFAQFFFSYNAPSWSISAEFFFYLCFPVLLLLMRRAVWLPIVASSVMVLLFITICNANHLSEDGSGWNMQGLIYINPLVRVFEFVTGMMTALLFRRMNRSSSLNVSDSSGDSLSGGNGDAGTQSANFGSAKTLIVGTGVETIAFALAVVMMFATLPLSTASAPYVGAAGAFWLKNSAIPLAAFDFLILVIAMGRGVISKFLSIPPMVLLGDISYAVYLVHYPLLMYRRCYLPQENSISSLVLFLAVLLTLSHLLFVFLERPVRHLITTLVLSDVEPATNVGAVDRMNSAAALVKRFATKLQEVLIGLKAQVVAFLWTPRKLSLLVVELIFLATMILLLHPTIDRVTSAEVSELLSENRYLAKEVGVGDALVISRVVSHRNKNSAEVELLFRAKKMEELDYYLYVQLLDGKANKIYEQSVNFSPLPTKVKAGDYWLQSINIPLKELTKAESIGIVVLKEKVGYMPFAGGKTDMGDYRLRMSAKSLGRQLSKDSTL